MPKLLRRHLNIFYVCVIGLIPLSVVGMCMSDIPALSLVKNKWERLANAYVAEEERRFLSIYGLTSRDINNQDIINELRSIHDQRVQEVIDWYASHIINSIDTKDRDAVHAIVNKVFSGVLSVKVRVFDDSSFASDDVSVLYHHATNTCALVLNISLLVRSIKLLEEILYHERSHIIHQDNFNKILSWYMARTRSSYTTAAIIGQSYAYWRSFETRADVYAVISSHDHGKHLIDFLKTLPDKGGCLTHPCISDRIALLQQIKQELDAVERVH